MARSGRAAARTRPTCRRAAAACPSASAISATSCSPRPWSSPGVGRSLRGTPWRRRRPRSAGARGPRRRRSSIGGRPWRIALVTISRTSRIASRAAPSGSAQLVERRRVTKRARLVHGARVGVDASAPVAAAAPSGTQATSTATSSSRALRHERGDQRVRAAPRSARRAPPSASASWSMPDVDRAVAPLDQPVGVEREPRADAAARRAPRRASSGARAERRPGRARRAAAARAPGAASSGGRWPALA